MTNSDLRLDWKCWRTPQFDAEHKATVYRLDVVVDAAPAIMERIHRVEYYLPPAWDASGRSRAYQIVVSRSSRFQLKDLTYASDLDVHAEVHVWGQSESVRLSVRVTVEVVPEQGFDYDLMFSYAHSDDENGWVSTLRSTIKKELQRRWGRTLRLGRAEPEAAQPPTRIVRRSSCQFSLLRT